MDRREKQIRIFEDTVQFYTENEALANATEGSRKSTVLYEPEDALDITESRNKAGAVSVTKNKTFAGAMAAHRQHPDQKIAVLNFASATNPGGGVKTGSSAQEESLCHCSTLYPTLTQDWLWRKYYKKNRDSHDNLHTDACIYSPGVIICKTDDSEPKRMEKQNWVSVDVISCAAPNLRKKPGTVHNPEFGGPSRISLEALYDLHVKRARQIFCVAAVNGVDILILGAFGCGAFANDPNVVARAYKKVLDEMRTYFETVEFAVYCRQFETENYDAFRKWIH